MRQSHHLGGCDCSPAVQLKHGLDCVSTLATGSLHSLQTKNMDTGIATEVPAKVFFPNNTREFKAKRVAEQISHIPGSPVWAFSLRQQQCWVLGNWRALSIWTFLKGYTVSHLPSLQTNRKRDRETSRRACHEASQAGVFWRYLLISCTTALTFVSLPFPFASFLLPLMFPFHRPPPPPPPFFLFFSFLLN